MEPGPAWFDLVARALGAGAALLPIDHACLTLERSALLDRAGRPSRSTGRGRAVDPTASPPIPRSRSIVPTSGTGGTPKFVEFDLAGDRRGGGVLRPRARSVRRRPLALLPPAGARRRPAGPAPGGPARRAGDDPRRVRRRRRRDGARLGLHLPRPHDARAARRGGADLSAFRTVLVGGAHLSPDLRADAERAGRERRRDLRPHGDVRGRRATTASAPGTEDADQSTRKGASSSPARR